VSRDLPHGLIVDIARAAGIEFLRGSTDDKKQIRCVDAAAHAHGDKRPSAFLSASRNLFSCSGCGLTLRAKDFAAHVGVEWKSGQATTPISRPKPTPAPKQVSPSRPANVSPFWSGCGSVYDDVQLHRALKARAIDPAIVHDRDLARALTASTTASWARFGGKDWGELGNRLIVPMYDATGALVTVHARRLDGDGEIPKGLSPAGCSHSGAVFADPGAQLLLAGEPLTIRDLTVIIAEGVPDFLTWATHYGDTEDAPIVLGVISGSWTPEIAARIPSGAKVIVRMHTDEAGQKYARAIADTLIDRCDLWRPALDENPRAG
jgi:hypothetical protein